MANDVTFRLNGDARTVSSAPDTPLLYVLTDELALQGPRFGCGLGQCGSCSVLVNGRETRSCITRLSAVAGKSVTTLEGLPAWYAGERRLPIAPALHPVQQALHRRAGAAVRLLLQRHDHQGVGAARTDAAADRGADSHRAERSPLPVRHLPAGGQGGSPCGSVDGVVMSNRRDFLKASGTLIVGFSLGDRLLGQEPPAAPGRSVDLANVDTWLAIHARQHRHGVYRLRRAGPGRLDRAAAGGRRGTRSRSVAIEDRAARDGRDTKPGRHLLERGDQSRLATSAQRGSRGAPRAAAARRRAAGRAARPPRCQPRYGLGQR